MSQENVETVRRSVEAYRRGDLGGVLAAMADDVELDLSAVRGPYRGVYRGRDVARELMRAFRESWQSITAIETEYLEVDPDRVILVTRQRFVGRGSGVEVGGGGMAAVYALRDARPLLDAGAPEFVKCLVDHRAELAEVGPRRVELRADDDLVLVDDRLRRVALDEAGA